MKYPDNINQVAELKPDYLGFIFYENSARNFNDNIPQTDKSIKKVGVVVNAKKEDILRAVIQHHLQIVQLHGNETPEFCASLKSDNIEIIKVFSIKDEFDFKVLEAYEKACDYFLFDTKGKLPGGNGYKFNWSILNNYPSKKPFFLSGGIGLNELNNIQNFRNSTASKYCFALDINSQFEIEPGLKDIEKLKIFKSQL